MGNSVVSRYNTEKSAYGRLASVIAQLMRGEKI